ncbi:hypothetical protein BDB01DRAFT_848190 [Pilobolus umbonatus]|nr:hypothetical protein BDB01DRAFT_848190 [Pilobolus umbonatus]
MADQPQLISSILLPELNNQIQADNNLWPNLKGLFIITVTKKKKAAATWYLLFQGNTTRPVISTSEEEAKAAAQGRIRAVKIQIDDNDLLHFITGGMNGVRAYMTGKIKVKGDLMLAQRLEEVFQKLGGKERAIEFIKQNEQSIMPSYNNFPSSLPYFEELHDQQLLNRLVSSLGVEHPKDSAKVDKVVHHPFMDAFNAMLTISKTANGANTFTSSGDDCIDLFYRLQAATEENMAKAWKEDQDFALRTIFCYRSIHRGKSMLLPFLKGYCWLLMNHPQTALYNLPFLVDGKVRTDAALNARKRKEKKKDKAEDLGWEYLSDDQEEVKTELLLRRDFKSHGCWKDLCTILAIYAQGEVFQSIEVLEEYKALKWPQTQKTPSLDTKNAVKKRYSQRAKMTKEEAVKDLEKSKEMNKKHNKEQEIQAKKDREDLRRTRNDTVQNLMKSDTTYRALHLLVARLFAEQLKLDMEQLKKNKETASKERYILGHNLSLAAKWAPSLYGSHDKHTFLATSIGEILFPPKSFQDKGESREHYLNKVRNMYRKEYLIPLREALDIIEHYKNAAKWAKVDYGHIPSVCMKKNFSQFYKHSPEQLLEYLAKVSKGKAKVSGATLTPAHLVASYYHPIPPNMENLLRKDDAASAMYKEATYSLLNGQWETLLESIRNTSLLGTSTEETSDPKKSNKVDLGQCIAVCDVSGSMMQGHYLKPETVPLFAAVGLSLLLCNLAQEPFNGGFITFSEEPSLASIDTSKPFTEQVKSLIDASWGYSTDLVAVFTKLLLPMAKRFGLKKEDMVKRIFVFTDMEFDANTGGEFETTYEHITKQYNEAGYDIPELIWWNLCSETNHRMTVPVKSNEMKCALLSGFSANSLKTFLDGDIDIDNSADESKSNSQEDDQSKNQKEEISPIEIAKKELYHASYDGLMVVD